MVSEFYIKHEWDGESFEVLQNEDMVPTFIQIPSFQVESNLVPIGDDFKKFLEPVDIEMSLEELEASFDGEQLRKKPKCTKKEKSYNQKSVKKSVKERHARKSNKQLFKPIKKCATERHSRKLKTLSITRKKTKLKTKLKPKYQFSESSEFTNRTLRGRSPKLATAAKESVVMMKEKVKKMVTSKDKKTINVQRKFQCEKCNLIFHNFRQLNIHKDLHDQEPEKTFSCGKCDTSFNSMGFLLKHARVHWEKNETVSKGESSDAAVGKWCGNFQNTGKLKLCKDNSNSVFKNLLYPAESSNPLLKYTLNPAELSMVGNNNTLLKNLIRPTESFNDGLNTSVHEVMDKDYFDDEIKDSEQDDTLEVGDNSYVDGEIKHERGKEFEQGQESLPAQQTEVIECVVCYLAFTDETQLEEHMKTHEVQKFPPAKGHRICVCHICGESKSNWSSLVNHIRTHTGERPFACEICGAAFVEKTTLTKHMVTHTKERKHICDQCGLGFCLQGKLTRHIKNVHSKIKPFKCSICPYASSRPETLRVHVQRRHLSERERADCEICKKCVAKDYMKEHMKLHNSKVDKFTCDVCNLTFTRYHSLVRHNRKHTGLKPHKCNHEGCKKAFNERGELERHVQCVHQNKSFSCEVCFRKFAFKTQRDFHMRLHTGEFQYACSSCTKLYKSRTRYLNHLEQSPKCKGTLPHLDAPKQSVIHKDESISPKAVKFHKCDVCSRRFACINDLLGHIHEHLENHKPVLKTVETKNTSLGN